MSARTLCILSLLAPLVACASDDESSGLVTETDSTTGTGGTDTGTGESTTGTTGGGTPVLDCPAFTPPQGPFTTPNPVTLTLTTAAR